jgi:hypothetical protein
MFVVQILQKKWNKICMKQLDGGKHMENDCFPRTLKFEMWWVRGEFRLILENEEVLDSIPVGGD